jgi:hypothetical protein
MSKKTQIAKIIRGMTSGELVIMADDLVSMQSAAEDDGSKWKLKTKGDWHAFLRSWAKGLGSME